LPPDTRALLRHPLLLRLAAEACASRELRRELTLDSLFELHFQKRMSQYGPSQQHSLHRFLVHAATAMYQRAQPDLDVHEFLVLEESRFGQADVYALYHFALDEGLISERKGRSVERFAFIFERYAEYVLGRYVLRQRLDTLGVETMLEEFAQKAQTLALASGSLTTCLRYMLVEERSTALRIVQVAVAGEQPAALDAISSLICDLETHSALDVADAVYDALHAAACPGAATVLENAREGLFWTASVERLQRLGERALTLAEVLGDLLAQARVHLWLGDVYYNRADDYAHAEATLRDAIRHLEGMADAAARFELYEAKYFLARVLSDSGDSAEARRLADECLAFFASRTDPRSKRGTALAWFLKYMIEGDAAGQFSEAKPMLETTRQLFAELGDARAVGRVCVNETVASLHTGEALERAREAVQLCKMAGDLQGEAYAELTLLAILCEKMTSLPAGEVTLEAYEALSRVEQLYKLTGEKYVHTLAMANRALLALAEGHPGEAERLLTLVMAEATTAGDFFNRFDAEVLLAGQIHRDRGRLAGLLEEAESHGYQQGIMHVFWLLHRLTTEEGDTVAAEAAAASARRIADRLGWGWDPRDSLSQGFYAGIFIWKYFQCTHVHTHRPRGYTHWGG